MSRKIRLIFLFVIATSALVVFSDAQQRQRDLQKLKQEEAENYYKRWLEEDVVYLITDEERAVFRNLTTSEERESFIEQFWQRRDPDPETGINEFREEHFRRLAYANDHFSIGAPGWKTDRGRIYIINGPPDSTEYHDQGETYYRPLSEGAGSTSTFAWQVWFYRHIPGIGDGIEIEFVDKTMTGHFVLARDEMDKDAMLWVPGMGLTEAERLGGASRAERIGTRTMANEATRRVGNPLKIFTQKDDLFARLRRYAALQSPPSIKFKDLESLVDINLYYNQLPFSVRHDLIRVTASSYLVPVTFYFNTSEFSFKQAGTIQQATLNVYGRVETMTKQKVYSFDDTVHLTLKQEGDGPPSSVFQRNIPLEPGRYKLIAIVKDVTGNKIGTLERGLIVPGEIKKPEIELSPIILADHVQPAKEGEFINDPFILSAVKVYPSPANRFRRGKPLGFYFEVYNVTADQQTLAPSLSVELKIHRDGKEIPTPFGDLSQIVHPYADRFFAGSMLNTQPLEPGRYSLSITVKDNVAETSTRQTANFEVLG
jgi:GWxTD domain-containing protein